VGRRPLTRVESGRYWSLTLQLGCPDKQPVTDGGRTIVLGLLFLTMLMQAVYTGSLNTVRDAVMLLPLPVMFSLCASASGSVLRCRCGEW
jgi:hypothetical protein